MTQVKEMLDCDNSSLRTSSSWKLKIKMYDLINILKNEVIKFIVTNYLVLNSQETQTGCNSLDSLYNSINSIYVMAYNLVCSSLYNFTQSEEKNSEFKDNLNIIKESSTINQNTN